MALGYGGNPYGPAGTGKTESVKALGQAMGRQVRLLRQTLHMLGQAVLHNNTSTKLLACDPCETTQIYNQAPQLAT